MHSSPKLTVDGIVLMNGRIILIQRKYPPFKMMFALPGGFVEEGETVESAVVREIEEETGLLTSVKKLVGVYSAPDRDPRGHTVSIVYELEIQDGKLKGGDDALTAETFDLESLPELAFDHGKIIKDYLKLIRA
jgi:8-oxo-dGTP diphosphatase